MGTVKASLGSHSGRNEKSFKGSYGKDDLQEKMASGGMNGRGCGGIDGKFNRAGVGALISVGFFLEATSRMGFRCEQHWNRVKRVRSQTHKYIP